MLIYWKGFSCSTTLASLPREEVFKPQEKDFQQRNAEEVVHGLTDSDDLFALI